MQDNKQKKKLLSMQINNFVAPQKDNVQFLYFKQEKEDVADTSEETMPLPKGTIVRKRPQSLSQGQDVQKSQKIIKFQQVQSKASSKVKKIPRDKIKIYDSKERNKLRVSKDT